jgi:superfamily II DNA or RNA helicase
MTQDERMSGHHYSDEVNVIDKLYSPCLKWANEYVRDAGYFSSHIYQAMSKEVLEFVLRDKKNHITLFTNIDIFPSDYDAIVNNSSKTSEHVYDELNEMLEMDEISDPIKMLAAMVRAGQMTVYVSLRKRDEDSPYSLDHSKSGFFFNKSSKQTVAFSGSFNETYPAVVYGLDKGHKEHFDIYAQNELDPNTWNIFGNPIVKRLRSDMEGEFPKYGGEGTIIVRIDDISKEQLPAMSDDDWDPQNHHYRAAKRSNQIYEIMDKRINKNKEILPSKNDRIILRPHQLRGLEQWRSNGCKGILEHATGSGKTITAITAIKDHVDQGLPAIILVPGRELLKQWHKEINEHIDGSNILCVGDGHSLWKKELHFWLDNRKQTSTKRIVIAIIHTARGDKFQNAIRSLNDCLIVVDECHRIGAPSFTNICGWNSNFILGLSATPQRFSDPEGNQRVLDFCGNVVDRYTIDQAMEDGYLSNYFYHVSSIGLTNDHEECNDVDCKYCETDRYDQLMEQVKKAISRYLDENGLVNFNQLPPAVQVMLFNAKRILKKAYNKTDRCAEIIQQNYVDDGTQFWLTYCEDREQLYHLKQKLTDLGIEPIYEFWSDAEGAETDYQQLDFDRDATLNMWESTGGVMLSIACLDEGVNIPCISHGVILASSQNPRQFIQRRGRLLRLSENKTHANIWDILVVPSTEGGGIHTNYVLAELNRALTFASNASNHQALQEIQNIAYRMGLILGFTGGATQED